MASYRPEFVDITTPPTCRLPHKGCVLPNGSKLLIVTDPNTQTAAAAMTVAIGSHWDPKEAPGLAHLCEHMLFLGTDRLPEEGAFDKFVSQNGGHTNAWTTDSSTTYYFTAKTASFTAALKDFVPFFFCPLLTSSAYEREVEAVHSEDEKNHSVDYWRVMEVYKQELYSTEHPQSRYGNGNKETLLTEPRAAGVDVCKLLRQFYEAYYVAPAMTLCVYSPLTAEEVCDIVLADMLSIRPGERLHDVWPVSPFKGGIEGSWLNVESVKELQHIVISLPVASRRFHNDGNYASHVIGHECDRTLFAVLKEDGLATELNCSVGGGIDNAYDWLSIQISLSPAGVTHVDRVIQLTAQAIALLKQTVATRDAVEEVYLEGELRFQFAEVSSSPHSHCTNLTGGAMNYDLADAWRSRYGVEKGGTTIDDVNRFIQSLDMSRVVFTFSVKNFETPAAPFPESFPPLQNVHLDRTGRFHKARYSRTVVDAAFLQQLQHPASVDPRLRLPPPNPFLTKEFAVVPLQPDSDVPITLEGDAVSAYGRAYFKPDSRFAVPKAAFTCVMENPNAYATPLNRFFMRVLVPLTRHVITEPLYFAELSSLSSGIGAEVLGLQFTAYGPTATMPRLVTLIANAVLTASFSETEFSNYADLVRREIASIRGHQPYQLCASTSQYATRTFCFDYEDILAASETATFDQFVTFVAAFRSALRFDCMVGGNIAQTKAVEMVAEVQASLQGLKIATVAESAFPRVRDVIVVPTRATLAEKLGAASGASATTADPAAVFGTGVTRKCPNPEDPNTGVIVEYLLGENTPLLAVQSDVLAATISSEFFNQLRTNETMGYVVQCAAKRVDQMVWLSFLVQSANLTPEYIISRIHAFVQTVPQRLAAQSDDDFNTIRSAQIAKRQEIPKNCLADVSGVWDRRKHLHGFDHRVKEIAALQALEKGSIARLFSALIAHDASDARCFVTVVSKQVDNHGVVGAREEAVGKRVSGVSAAAFATVDRTAAKSDDEIKKPIAVPDNTNANVRIGWLDTFTALREHVATGFVTVHGSSV